MAPGADLFVICKQCGSEVSPYITECPYCGHRLRRRAPKLPRGEQKERRRRRPQAMLGRLRPGEIPGIRAESRPYVTIAVVLVTCGVWVAWRGAYVSLDKLLVAGPLDGDWWKLITYQLTYLSGIYQWVTLVAIAIFGWLVERRHGPAVVAALFFGAGAAGALVELAIYPLPLASGANAGALALLAAWAVPDLRSLRGGRYYDSDMIGVAAFAATLLAMPLARIEASWVAGVTGGAIGLLVGAGLETVRPR